MESKSNKYNFIMQQEQFAITRFYWRKNHYI